MDKNLALETLKSFVENTDNVIAKDAIITLHPELADGKNERIGNLIYCIVRDREDVRNTLEANGVSVDDALAYLEKQKDNKFVPRVLPCSAAWFENGEEFEQKEQKPAEQLGGTFTSYDMAKTYTEGQNYVIAHPEKFGLCKPVEWSEEDKEMLQNVYESLYSYQCYIRGGEKNSRDLLDDVEREKDWLKDLPNRFTLHGWKKSLKTVDLENSLCDFQDTFGDCSHEYKILGDAIEYIRSTNPHWKPSKAQMEALKDAVKLYKETHFERFHTRIESLYEQLKSL